MSDDDRVSLSIDVAGTVHISVDPDEMPGDRTALEFALGNLVLGSYAHMYPLSLDEAVTEVLRTKAIRRG